MVERLLEMSQTRYYILYWILSRLWSLSLKCELKVDLGCRGCTLYALATVYADRRRRKATNGAIDKCE